MSLFSVFQQRDVECVRSLLFQASPVRTYSIHTGMYEPVPYQYRYGTIVDLDILQIEEGVSHAKTQQKDSLLVENVLEYPVARSHGQGIEIQ